MSQGRTDSINKVLDELEAFEINPNQYLDDLEPRSFIDEVLTGKINTLLAFCQTLGWADLIQHLQHMTPLNGDAMRSLDLLKGYVIPEARGLLAAADADARTSPTQWFWEFVHPRIATLARTRFEAGFYGDAVETSFKEVNIVMKRMVKEITGNELDGAGLMTTAFSPVNPLIKLSALESDTDRNIQQGYMQIFAGAMTGIRNPKAHGNLNPDGPKALHLIALASLLMHKIDERVE